MITEKSWNAEETLFHNSLTDTNYALRPPVCKKCNAPQEQQRLIIRLAFDIQRVSMIKSPKNQMLQKVYKRPVTMHPLRGHVHMMSAQEGGRGHPKSRFSKEP